MKKRVTEEKIEKQMEKALNKIPTEMKKIKFLLSITKRINNLKAIFKSK